MECQNSGLVFAGLRARRNSVDFSQSSTSAHAGEGYGFKDLQEVMESHAMIDNDSLNELQAQASEMYADKVNGKHLHRILEVFKGHLCRIVCSILLRLQL